MNGIYAIIIFLCLQEFTEASYYRIPKRYFKKQRQEIKQAKNAPVKIPARNIPVLLPVTEQPIQNLPETSTIPETNENSNESIVLNDDVPILKTNQPMLNYELPKMPTLPILTILPLVASLPVVKVAPRLPEKLPVILPETLAEVKIQDVASYPEEDEFDDDDESDEEIEESVTVNVLQEVKYEIYKREPKKSPILHKVHRIEEFKRNIKVDRRDDPRNDRISEREGNMDLKEYLQRIAVRAELQRN